MVWIVTNPIGYDCPQQQESFNCYDYLAADIMTVKQLKYSVELPIVTNILTTAAAIATDSSSNRLFTDLERIVSVAYSR